MNGTANTDDKGPVRVRIYLDTNWVGASTDDHIEIDRAEWDAMTPAERREALDGAARALMENTVEYGWIINDPEDEAATEDGAR